MTKFYELDGRTYHEMLLRAHRTACQRADYLRANIARARLMRLRQFRYVYFIKRAWRSRLRLPVRPYPKPEEG